MTPEQFFKPELAAAIRSNGVKNLLPIEVDISEVISTMREKGHRVYDPLDLSNEQTPFIHNGTGRYAVVRLSEDEGVWLEVLTLLTKVDGEGRETCPYVMDTDINRLQRFLFE